MVTLNNNKFYNLIIFKCRKVAVNGKHFVSYKHQLPIKIIDHIKFHGDVSINVVRQFN